MTEKGLSMQHTPTAVRAHTERLYKPPLLERRIMRTLASMLFKMFLYIILTTMAILFVVPLVWVLSSSLKYPAQVFSIPIRWIPDPIQWYNYIDVFELVPFARYALNSLIVAGSATIGAVFSSSVVAFSLSRLRWPGRHLVFIMVLGTMMLPAVVTLIPTFIIMKNLGWLDTFLPLIVPSWFGANAFYIFLMRQFMLGVPLALDEAARIDGAGSFRIYTQIILPLSKSVIAAVVIFAFLDRYNDLLGPAMYLTTEQKYTLSIGLHALSGTYGNYWPYVMAASTLMTLPIVLIFIIFQRQFIQGIQMTGMTGR
jgi:multiple sugar transport system permease protein